MRYHQINTCRFCKKHEFDGDKLVKYGVRHYAHHACFLDNGHTLSELRDWQVRNFPWRVIRDRNLTNEAEAADRRWRKEYPNAE